MSKLFAGLSSSCCRRVLALPVSHSRCCGKQVIKSSWCKHDQAAASAEYLFRSFVSDMCARAYHWGGCRYHERQGFALGSSSSSSACSFMAAGLWCLCSYPLLAILISGLPWMTPPFEHPCAQVGRPSVPQAFHRHIARMPHKLCPCPLFNLFHLVLNLSAQFP